MEFGSALRQGNTFRRWKHHILASNGAITTTTTSIAVNESLFKFSSDMKTEKRRSKRENRVVPRRRTLAQSSASSLSDRKCRARIQSGLAILAVMIILILIIPLNFLIINWQPETSESELNSRTNNNEPKVTSYTQSVRNASFGSPLKSIFNTSALPLTRNTIPFDNSTFFSDPFLLEPVTQTTTSFLQQLLLCVNMAAISSLLLGPMLTTNILSAKMSRTKKYHTTSHTARVDLLALFLSVFSVFVPREALARPVTVMDVVANGNALVDTNRFVFWDRNWTEVTWHCKQPTSPYYLAPKTINYCTDIATQLGYPYPRGISFVN